MRRRLYFYRVLTCLVFTNYKRDLAWKCADRSRQLFRQSRQPDKITQNDAPLFNLQVTVPRLQQHMAHEILGEHPPAKHEEVAEARAEDEKK